MKDKYMGEMVAFNTLVEALQAIFPDVPYVDHTAQQEAEK